MGKQSNDNDLPDAKDLKGLTELDDEALRELDERILREKEKHQEKKESDQAKAQQTGMKAGSEFIAAVLGGGFVGYFADKFLGTTPLFMIFMMLVGFGYGIYRAYSVMNEEE